MYPAETGATDNFSLTLPAQPTKPEDVRPDSYAAFSHFSLVLWKTYRKKCIQYKKDKVLSVLN